MVPSCEVFAFLSSTSSLPAGVFLITILFARVAIHFPAFSFWCVCVFVCVCVCLSVCVQDHLHRHMARVSERSPGQGLEMVKKALVNTDEIIVQHAHGWEQQPATNVRMLEAVAGARFGLTQAAKTVCLAIQTTKSLEDTPLSSEQTTLLQSARSYLNIAKPICTKFRLTVFFLKQLVRRLGLASFRQAVKDKGFDLEWTLPDDMTGEDDDRAVIDRFIVHKDAYRELREAVAGSVLSGDVHELQGLLRKKKKNLAIITTLALYREVTMRCANRLLDDQATEATREMFLEFINTCLFYNGDGKNLVTMLVQNAQSPDFHRLQAAPDWSSAERSLSALVVHFITVLTHKTHHCRLLFALSRLAFNPDAMAQAFLPTMPEDDLFAARQAFDGGQWYVCPRGHPYLITECGRPLEEYVCDCGERIGGTKHKLLDSNQLAEMTDKSQRGYVLGLPTNTQNRTPVPERSLTPAATMLLRIMVDASLLWAAGSGGENQHSVRRLTSARIDMSATPAFYWARLEYDVELLSKTIGKGFDDALVVVHQTIRHLSEVKPGESAHVSTELKTRESRKAWEDAFNRLVLEPALRNLESDLQEGWELMTGDHRLGNDPLMRAVFETDRVAVSGGGQPGYLLPSLWRYRVLVNVEHLSYSLKNTKEFPVLSSFLRHEHNLRALQYLPDVVQLHRYFLDRWSRRVSRADAARLTLKQFLRKLPPQEKEMVLKLIESFDSAWVLVRDSIMRTPLLSPGEENSFKRVSPSLRLDQLLPTTTGRGKSAYSLVVFLVNVQNNFLAEYYGMTDKDKRNTPRVSLHDATAAQLVAYDTDHHLLPLIMAHCQYTLEVGKGTFVQYSLAALEKQLEQRFIVGRAHVDRQDMRVIFSDDVRNTSDLTALRQRIPQEELNAVVQRQIATELQSLPDVCKALETVQVALGFLSSSGGVDEVKLSFYLDKVLKMNPTDLISPKLQEACQLRHLLSVWQLLQVQRARRLVKNGQDPFEDVDPVFKDELTDDLIEAVDESLRDGFPRDVFLRELMEYIQVTLASQQASSKLDSFPVNQALDSPSSSDRSRWERLPGELEVRHATAMWLHVLAQDGRSSLLGLEQHGHAHLSRNEDVTGW